MQTALQLDSCIVVKRSVAARAGLRMTVDGMDWMTFAGEADNGADGLAIIRRVRPTFALIDLTMPRLDGFAMLKTVREEGLKTSIILFAETGQALVAQRAMREGACGYFTKGSPPELLRYALEQVKLGNRFVDPGAAVGVLNGDAPSLSERQGEVLELIAAGCTNAQIAGLLCITVETVRSHVAAVLRRLHARTRAHAVAIALGESLISVSARG